MPTYDVFASFWRDWRSLTPQQQLAFMQALEQFKADLRSGTFRPGLRVKRVQWHPGVWQMTWAADGRATFEYGEEIRGEPHVSWRRIGPTTSSGGPDHMVAQSSCTRLVPAPETKSSGAGPTPTGTLRIP